MFRVVMRNLLDIVSRDVQNNAKTKPNRFFGNPKNQFGFGSKK